MKFAGCLLLLCGVLRVALGIEITLTEEGGPTLHGIVGSPRSIKLVIDRTYSLSCDGSWYHNNMLVGTDPPPSDVSGAYTTSGSDGMELHLQLFSVDLAGQYVCQGGNGDEFIINISSGNPIVIPQKTVIGLKKGFRSELPLLRVLTSGDPPPTPYNHSWLFNGNSIYMDGAPVTGTEATYESVDFNKIVLHDRIVPSIGGLYRSIVETREGNATADIQVNVEVEPSPEISIVLPANYSDTYLAKGDNVTLTCRDTEGIPAPNITWKIGDKDVEGDGGIDISTATGGRESNLTILSINESHVGANVSCVAVNIVENKEITKETKTTLLVLTPPTNLTAVSLSNCEVMLAWSLHKSHNTSRQHFMIEVQVGGGNWTMVDDAVPDSVTSHLYMIRESGGMVNMTYNFRISTGNVRGGVSPQTTQSSGSVRLYYNALPSVSISATPLVSRSSPPSISLHWANPSTKCYQFSSHSASCTSPDSSASVLAIGDATQAVVSPLAGDQHYTCMVQSTVRDLEGQEFPVISSSNEVSSFTYPDYPAPPPKPQPASGPHHSLNITVTFSVAGDHSNISHYQVLVIRLLDEKDLPSGNPDNLYPNSSQLKPEESVNDRTSFKPLNGPYIAAEISAKVITTGSFTFIIGGGKKDEYSSNYSNGPLLPNTIYTCFLRAFPNSSVLLAGQRRRQTGSEEKETKQYSVFSSSPFMEVQRTGSKVDSGGSKKWYDDLSTPPAIAIVVVVVVLLATLIVVLVVIVIYCKKRRRSEYGVHPRSASSSSPPSYYSSKESLDGPVIATPDLSRKAKVAMEMKPLDLHVGAPFSEDDGEMIPSGAIPVNMFREHVEKFDENRQLLFQHEFDWIQANAPTRPSEASNLSVNDEKNRYSNITAFDHSRVVLSTVEGVDGSDYINANYIPGFNKTQEYIATQGPLDQTVADFWRMIWECNTATIVMLTNLVELGKVKCSQYWPSPAVGTITCGDIEIKLDNVVELRDYTIRNFTVTHVPSSQSHTVLQFHYTKWPDYGTPKLAAPLLNFLRAVHTSNPPEAGPITVHCSAGVGRSGTVLTIDYCLNQLKADHVVDVRGFVSRMREHRNYMVQTEVQYAFIHYAILEAITYGNTSFSLTEFPEHHQLLQEMNKETGCTHVQDEYNRLDSVKTMSKLSTFIQRVKQKGPTNRSIHYPGHGSYSEVSTPHEYNAHYIDAYFTSKLFIVADGPQERNAAKFWQMVWDQDCTYIIMLTPLDSVEYSYWPDKGGEKLFGNIKVTLEEETAEHYYTTRVISLSNIKVIGISQKVTQYQFVGWTVQLNPPAPSFVSFVCDVLKGVETLQKNQKALIHDTKSMGPSGIFCSLCYCIERLRVERMVDVFQAVQSMKLQRPGSVQSIEDYAFIYDCVYEFVRTHSTS